MSVARSAGEHRQDKTREWERAENGPKASGTLQKELNSCGRNGRSVAQPARATFLQRTILVRRELDDRTEPKSSLQMHFLIACLSRPCILQKPARFPCPKKAQ